MRIRALAHRKTWTQFVLIALLSMGLCMIPCGTAEHHASMGTPSILCIVDLPQVFHLAIAMNILLFAISPLIIPFQLPAFPLFKPPRSLYSH